ncbi:hypothetical protein K0M31_016878 [Melipona bicolor]|uniref:Uncharacterized protein n=1 Tax=Melipona bicolor TaxID=60889 RepID=A0AA40KEI8_9HYME|nr:hypothetical protein K0M31_016878 [Melipona bicolor]
MQKGREYANIQGHINPDIFTKNRYSVFDDCVINELDSGFQNTRSQNDIPNAKTAANLNPPTKKSQNVKPSPMYIHGKIDHLKFLEALKSK